MRRGPKPRPPAARVLERCVLDGECLIYQGVINNNGYGQIGVDRKPRLVHRVVYEATIGAIPAGLDLMHSCDRRPCVTVAHLSPGTRKQNMADAKAKGRLCSGERRRAISKWLCGDAHPATVITSDDMADVRMLAGWGVSQKQIAAEYGVLPSCISRRLSGARGSDHAVS